VNDQFYSGNKSPVEGTALPICGTEPANSSSASGCDPGCQATGQLTVMLQRLKKIAGDANIDSDDNPQEHPRAD